MIAESVFMSDLLFLSDLYIMQRANGDVFAVDNHGRFRVPLFNSSSDAFLARLRNFGMLLFKPVQLDAGLLKQLVPVGGAAEVDFWLVNDPLINLNHGRLLEPAQLAVLMESRIKLKPASDNTTGEEISSLSLPLDSNSNARAVWEDEGGRYAKCA
jgi:hypothetical protein